MLQDIAQEANFVVTYVDIEELSVSGEDSNNYIELFLYTYYYWCSFQDNKSLQFICSQFSVNS